MVIFGWVGFHSLYTGQKWFMVSVRVSASTCCLNSRPRGMPSRLAAAESRAASGLKAFGESALPACCVADNNAMVPPSCPEVSGRWVPAKANVWAAMGLAGCLLVWVGLACDGPLAGLTGRSQKSACDVSIPT